MVTLVSDLSASAFSWISGRGVRTALPPVLGLGVAVGLLLTGGVGWRTSGHWWDGLDGGSRVLLAALAAVALFMLTTVVMLLLPSLTRVYEGQWGRGWPGRALRQVAIRRQVRLMRHLKASARENASAGESADVGESAGRGGNAYMRRYYLYPPSERDVRPTRLGNVLGAAELYPGDPRRYGADASFFWPRLYPLLPDVMRAALADARSAMESLLLFSAFAVAFAATALVSGIAGVISPAAAVIGGASGLVVSPLAYRLAVRAGLDFGELIRASFDVYRRDLLRAMGYPPPGTLDEERDVWRAVSKQLYRRGTGTSDEAHLRMQTGP